MVAIGSRRALLIVGTSIGTTWLPLEERGISPSLLPTILCNYTPQAFRLAVAATGCFLYRGETSIASNHEATVLDPEPDLLLPGTYDHPSALAYFQCLEHRLQQRRSAARPSVGHIATSDLSEASQWGPAVSVWPLGDSMSYVWPRRGKVFFSPAGTYNCPGDDLEIDRGLNLALKLGHEVLFTSTVRGNDSLPSVLRDRRKSAFLAVPVCFDETLSDIAKQPEFTAAV
jgi:hypothetical protein